MIKKPVLLKKGDPIAIIAPGAAFNSKRFRAGIKKIKEMGLVPVFSPNLFKKDFIFAGTVAQRVSDIKKVLKNKKIKAVWCVRGGYGTYAVAEELAKIKSPGNPKVFLGQSDILALHMVCLQNWKWPAFHGPLVDRLGKSEVEPREIQSARDSLLNPHYRLRVNKNLKAWGKKANIKGVMTGGNLALAVSSLKTKWEIQTDGKILFLEDIGERAYRIDRMLFQLKAAGKLSKLKAVVLGDFTECQEPDGRNLTITVLKRYFEHAPYPVLAGIRSGHGNLRLTLPLGLKVRVQTTSKLLFEVLETYARF